MCRLTYLLTLHISVLFPNVASDSETLFLDMIYLCNFILEILFSLKKRDRYFLILCVNRQILPIFTVILLYQNFTIFLHCDYKFESANIHWLYQL